MPKLTPSDAALYGLVAIAFVSLGAILTGDTTTFTIAERGTVLGGIVAVLAGVAYLGRRLGKEGD
jgi:putative Mn2+ efflux pump MntP